MNPRRPPARWRSARPACSWSPGRISAASPPRRPRSRSQCCTISRANLLYLTRLTHDLSLVSVRGRLARLLLSRAQAEDQTLLRWTQGEIAADIGTVREVVNRTLRAFAREGLIEIQRQRITILDLAGLEAESEF